MLLKNKKYIPLFCLIIIVVVFSIFAISGQVKSGVQELLWQRIFWGCRDGGFNNGIFSMAEYKGKLYVGTSNLASGGEIWSFNGKDWKDVNLKEIPIEELPLHQRTLLRLQEANPNYIIPSLLLVAVANLLSAIPLSSLLPYLTYLFQLISEPLLYFGRKKKKWGVVYNSLTKQPVDLAIVRLYDKENGKLLGTKVTNLEGRYLFIAEMGKEYYLEVTKPGYIFPSKFLAEVKKDRDYDNLYYGKPFQMGEKKETGFISYNIPLDPQPGLVKNAEFTKPYKSEINNLQNFQKFGDLEKKKELRRIIWSSRFRAFNRFVAYLGPVLALASFILTPRLLTYVFLMLHVALLLLFRRLAVGGKIKPWGRVFDVKNLKSLPKAAVRLFDTKQGRLLSVFVTKADGRYGFLIGEGEEYSLISEKEGYSFTENIAQIVGEKEVKKDLPMKKN